MGLRDTVLQQQALEEEKKKATEKAAKTAKKKGVKPIADKKEETPAKPVAHQKAKHPPLEKCKAEFEALKAALEKNEVPKEWVELCDSTFKKLEEYLKNFKDKTFEIKYDITKKEYSKWYYEGDAAQYSPALLLNKYMTQRLEKEGFFNAVMKVTTYITTFSTPEDEKKHMEDIESCNRENGALLDAWSKANAEWQAKNSLFQSYLNSNSGGINAPSAPGRAPIYPTLKKAPPAPQSGKKEHFCILVKGSLLDEKELKKHNAKVKKEKKKAEKQKKGKQPLHPIFIGLIIMGAGLLIVLIGMLAIPAFNQPLFQLFKEYPLSTWSNISHYEKYYRALLCSMIPGGVFLAGKFLFWVFEKLIERFF